VSYASRTGDFATLKPPAGYTFTGSANPTLYRATLGALPATTASSTTETLAAPVRTALAIDLKLLNDRFLVDVESGDEADVEERQFASALVCR
jgi:hypothetical protein